MVYWYNHIKLLNILSLTIISIISLTQSCTDSNNNECNYCLSQQDFNDGTYRATQSGVYCLEENIVFNPDPGNMNEPNDKGSWFPTDNNVFPGCVEAADGPYALGFFAALSIQINDVILDLNGYTMQFHQHFYLQQRFAAIIEIGAMAFLPNFGPADFGNYWVNIHNVTICNGQLGLSSHHGIHSNNASNIIIKNLKIFDFEVAGIQLNGAHNAVLKNLEIGPSFTEVPLKGVYSNARFLILALRQLLTAIYDNNLEVPSVSFAYLDASESLTLQEIHDNLIQSMDLVFREASDELLQSEMNDPLYQKGIKLFKNMNGLPDGATIYGILFNSHSVAVDGFGDSLNGPGKGEDIIMEDIYIHDLILKVKEIPTMYFDQCLDTNSDTKTVLKGPFGDVLDITEMVGEDKLHLIEEYSVSSTDLSDLEYDGNPLSDAQIGLYLFRNYVGDGTNYAFGSIISTYFLQWALNDYGVDNEWPICGGFVCNGDIMFHTNKGVMGIRMDQIENVYMKDIKITDLENRTPLASCACSNYTGPHDGGNPGTKEMQGAMGTDMRGIAVIDGDVLIGGNNNVIKGLKSWYGDTTAFDLMHGAMLDFDDNVNVIVDDLSAATKLNLDMYEYLVDIGKSPYPNNFDLCNMHIQDGSVVSNAPIGLGEDDCVMAEIGATLPTQCEDRCDAFSVLLVQRMEDGDNVCLRYNVKRLHSDGVCKKSVKYVVLGVCGGDIVRAGCNDNDLNGLIESVTSDGELDSIDAWGTRGGGRLTGIRINIHVYDEQMFTICLKDVFEDDVYSNRVRFRRGRSKFICEEEYVMGLPCIDDSKFNHAAYSGNGYNYKYRKYGSDSYDRKGWDAHSISVNADDLDDGALSVVRDWDPYVLWLMVSIFIVFVIAMVIGGCICCGRKRANKQDIGKQIKANATVDSKTNVMDEIGCEQAIGDGEDEDEDDIEFDDEYYEDGTFN